MFRHSDPHSFPFRSATFKFLNFGIKLATTKSWESFNAWTTMCISLHPRNWAIICFLDPLQAAKWYLSASCCIHTLASLHTGQMNQEVLDRIILCSYRSSLAITKQLLDKFVFLKTLVIYYMQGNARESPSEALYSSHACLLLKVLIRTHWLEEKYSSRLDRCLRRNWKVWKIATKHVLQKDLRHWRNISQGVPAGYWRHLRCSV